VVSFTLLRGDDRWPIEDTVVVADDTTDFVHEDLRLPPYLTEGPYLIEAVGNKGRDAASVLTIATGNFPVISLTAPYATMPPNLDGVLRFGEWDYSQKADFENGFITVRSDETRLYVLLDLLADTGNNALGSGDSFWLSFDIWDDQVIDPGWDLNLRLDASGDMILEEYSGPGTFNPRNSTFLRSAYGASFGCFISDGSFDLAYPSSVSFPDGSVTTTAFGKSPSI